MLKEVARKNIQILNSISDFTGNKIVDDAKKGDWGSGLSSTCKCVSCGGNITYPIMQFYNWDGSRFKCYKCQNNNKQ